MKAPLQIALFVHVLDQVGGAEVATRRWADNLVARGYAVTFIGSQPMSRWSRQRILLEYDRGLRIVRLPVWQRTRQLADTMLVTEASAALLCLRHTKLLHVRAFAPDSMMIGRMAKRLGMKVVCGPMASGPYGDVACLPENLAPAAAAVFDWVSCQTQAVRDDIVQWGYPVERTSINPNGVDTAFFAPATTPPHPQSVLFVGQFRPEKRIGLLLDAWRSIQSAYPDARLTLVGGGDPRGEYQRQAGALGLRVNFLPILPPEGVREQLHRHAVFVMPGVSEGMSNALLEAMAAGLAPVVTNTPGNQAVVTTGVNGLTYESESASALAEALRYLFDHPDERQRLAQQAREAAIRHYSLDSVVDRYVSLYQRLLGVD